MHTCLTCDGTGYTIEYHAGVPSFEKLRCIECNGTGTVPTACHCDNGYVVLAQSYEPTREPCMDCERGRNEARRIAALDTIMATHMGRRRADPQ